MNAVTSLFKRGSRAKFEKIITPHLEPMYRVAFRYTKNASDAEDLVQEFVLSLYQKKIDLFEIKELRPWLMRGLYNKFVDNFRQSKRDPLHQHDELELTAVADIRQGPMNELSREELQKQLLLALQQVNEDQRILLMLHDVEGYTLTELTEILDVPIGTLKSRLHRGRAQLRRILNREPFAPDLRVV
ncbi:MAG TPA: RNA polymerase sigma factor [Gammaproteobacteria bacterium]|nr:RNA polymerase sigma factor [Gammaproteobacteria bacterium]